MGNNGWGVTKRQIWIFSTNLILPLFQNKSFHFVVMYVGMFFTPNNSFSGDLKVWWDVWIENGWRRYGGSSMDRNECQEFEYMSVFQKFQLNSKCWMVVSVLRKFIPILRIKFFEIKRQIDDTQDPPKISWYISILNLLPL